MQFPCLVSPLVSGANSESIFSKHIWIHLAYPLQEIIILVDCPVSILFHFHLYATPGLEAT